MSRLLIPVLLVLMAATSHAGVVSYGASDFCNMNTPGITKGPLEFVGTGVETNQAVPAYFNQTDNYRYQATSTGPGGTFDLGYFPCQKLSSFQVNNAVEDEPLGEAMTEESLPEPSLIPLWLQEMFLGIDGLLGTGADRYGCGRQGQPDCPIGGGGIRGSLEIGEVLDLQTASPAYYTFQPAAGMAGLTSLAIPFTVIEPGSGDWLSMYLGSQLFFQQPLAEFEAGRLYFAPVPVAGVINNPAITLWINSFGPAGTRVVFPTAVSAVPLPPAALLFVTALGCMARRMRRRTASRHR